MPAKKAASARTKPLQEGLKEGYYEQIADILKAVAHPIRIQIIAILCQEETHVNDLADRLQINQAVVSQQLRILRMRRLVQVSRIEGLAVYRLAEPQLRELITCIEKCQLD